MIRESKMPLLPFFIFILSFSLVVTPTSPIAIGVSFNPNTRGLPSGEAITAAITSAGVTHLLLRNPTPKTLRSFLFSSISLVLEIPNSLIPSLISANSTAALRWSSSHILPFYPRVQISSIAVGHDVLSDDVFHAVAALRSSFNLLRLPDFPLTTFHSFSLLQPHFPPSAAAFHPFLADGYVRPLRLLNSTSAPFLIDISPFDLYRSDPNVPLDFALFHPDQYVSFRDDPANGLRYRDLFDEMVDAALSALSKLGYYEIPLVVTGTGWPTAGNSAANSEYAARYNRGLVGRLRKWDGTPMRGAAAVREVYVRELVDDETINGDDWERHWGIWYKNLSAKYELRLTGASERPDMGIAVAVICGLLAVAFILLSS